MRGVFVPVVVGQAVEAKVLALGWKGRGSYEMDTAPCSASLASYDGLRWLLIAGSYG